MRRYAVVAVAASLAVAACGGSGGPKKVTDTYEINLQGEATVGGKLVLAAPTRIEVDVAEGARAQDVTLSIRDELQRRGFEILCTIDRQDQGFAVVVQGRVEISSAKSQLGGVGGTASQVIERAGVIESATREYLRHLRENNRDGLRRWVTEPFFEEATRELGRGATIVNLRPPSIGCHSASTVVEVVYLGGEHVESELQLVTDNGHEWRVDSSRVLAKWSERTSAQVKVRVTSNGNAAVQTSK